MAACIRATPEDFQVDEIPLFEPCGEGAHTFLRIEKRSRTTEEVARSLAQIARVKPRDVGYAGRKDRVAVTTQWFSVPGLEPASGRALDLPGVRVLDAVPHRHKLRTGQLRGNRFRIAVRDAGPQQCADAARRFAELAAGGMPNRYGPQRFGRDGANAERAVALLAGRRPAGERIDRRQARFLVSALQAAVFNDVLAARPLPLGTLEAGDVAVLHASGGQFVVEDPAEEQPRADAGEISPTGPIFGLRVIQPTGAPAERERTALHARGLDLATLRAPAGVRLRGARRALRVWPMRAHFAPLAPRADGEIDGFRLEFELPAGSYATVLVEEVLREVPQSGPVARLDASSRRCSDDDLG